MQSLSRRPLLVALALVLAACGGETGATTSQPAAETTAAPNPTTVSPTTTGGEATTSSVEPTTSATSLASTTSLGTGQPAIRIDEVVFAGEPYLVIANKGTGPGSSGGFWICQFPSYFELPAFELQPGERLTVPLGEGIVPDLVGVIGTVDVIRPIGVIDAEGGEIGLYSADRFNDPEAIVDYLEWGSGNHARSGVAVQAQIWVDGGFVEVPPELLAIVAQAFPTLGPDDWFAEIGG